MKKLFLPAFFALMFFAVFKSKAQSVFFTLPPNPPYCVNQNIQASITSIPSGAVSFSWSVMPLSIISIVSATQALITFTACGQPTVFCTAYDASGNPVALSGITTSVTCPGLTITPMSQTICPGATATLAITGANSYTWSNSLNSATINPIPLGTTSYSVISTNTNGCGATATVKVMSLSINASYLAACPGNTVALAAFGGNTYSWTGSTFVNPVVQNSISVLAGTYTVSSVSNSGICTKSISIITAPPLAIQITVSPVQGTTCIETNYSPGKFSKPVTITASGAQTYSWVPYNYYPPQTGGSITVRPAVNTCYTVTGLTTVCSGSAIACVTVIPQFTMDVSPATSTICLGDSIKLSIGNIQQPPAVGPSSLITYYWNDPPTSPPPSITAQNTPTVKAFPQTNTTYTVEVFDGRGCASVPFLVAVNVATCVDTWVPSYESKNEMFTIYPNPVKEVLSIQSKNEMSNLSFELTDITGRKLNIVSSEQRDPNDAYQLDLSELKPGIYFLNLFSDGKILSGNKVMKE